MSRFDNYAREKMLDLVATSDKQVGSNYQGNKAGLIQTNCIDFVTKVLVYAYEKTGNQAVAAEVKKRVHTGTELAKYLVEMRTWRAYYWNPDVRHPSDQKDEHPYSYKQATKHKKYYGIPLAGAIIDFRPTPLTKGATKAKTAALRNFEHVPFAVGIALGGYHTFLCSNGQIYEVHWAATSDGLYEISDFATYGWLSGIVVIPPKTTFKSDAL